MKVFALLVFLAVTSYSFAALPIVPCSKNAMDLTTTGLRIMTAEYPECTNYPCEVKRGSNATVMISVKDIAGATINKLNNKVYGIIAGIPVPFPGYPTDAVDACKLASNSSKCPINNGDSFTEKVSLPVTSSAPAMTVTAKWELVEPDTKKIEGCFYAQLKLM